MAAHHVCQIFHICLLLVHVQSTRHKHTLDEQQNSRVGKKLFFFSFLFYLIREFFYFLIMELQKLKILFFTFSILTIYKDVIFLLSHKIEKKKFDEEIYYK